MNNPSHTVDSHPLATQPGGMLPVGVRAGIRVMTVAVLLIAAAVMLVCFLVVEPGHRLITGFVIGGMMTFIGLPFIFAAAQDEVERITSTFSH